MACRGCLTTDAHAPVCSDDEAGGKPKRPLSGYMMFFQNIRPKLMKEGYTFGQAGKEAGSEVEGSRSEESDTGNTGVRVEHWGTCWLLLLPHLFPYLSVYSEEAVRR